MTLIEAIILGVLQGITEFLPVSSSGHLILGQSILGLNPENLKSFDIAIHFGTLLAILIYFAKDIGQLIVAFGQTIGIAKPTTEKGIANLKEQQKMIMMLIIATIPAVIVGVKWGDYLDEHFLNPVSVAILLILVGVVFLLAEWLYEKNIDKKELTIGKSILIGLAQAVALIPGVSRSGASISAGLALGIERNKAARFSFLLGSIAITAATSLAVYKTLKGEYVLPPLDILVTGVISSFVAGWASINFLMKYIKNHSLAVFTYYRWIVAGCFLIYYFTLIRA